jgi:hypothetical protein
MFLRNFRNNFLQQHVMEPTRQRESDTPHILDLVITNDQFISDITYLSPLGCSDHSVLTFSCSLELDLELARNDDKWNFHKGNYNDLRCYLRRNWDIEFQGVDNANDLWIKFKTIIMEGMDKYIPQKNSKVGCHGFRPRLHTVQPFNDNIKKMINKKHRAWTRVIETRTAEANKKFKKIRNKVRSETRKLIIAEQADIAKCCKSNPKICWKFVKSKTNYRSGVGDLKFTNTNGDEVLTRNDNDKADALVGFFSEVFTKEDNDIIEDLKPHTCTYPIGEFSFKEEDIFKKLKTLKVDKSPGMDGIHPRVLYELREELVYSLRVIFETSLNSGTLPLDWKLGVVTAIYKKGVKTDMGNYRPVSLTSIVCKVMESLLRDHIMSYLTINKLISNRQYGFMKGRSTAMQMLHMLDKWTEYLESGGQIDTIYTDFEKAFDKVPHRRLMNKLRTFGLNPKIVQWMKSFLMDRKQCVRVNGKYSRWMPVISGIPQGTILGPLMFLVYINDMPDIFNGDVEAYLFADDAKLFKFIKVANDQLILQNNIDELVKWSDRWLMKLSVKKCRQKPFGRDINSKYDYTITVNQNAVSLGTDEYITDLGVILDEELKFSHHIHEKIKKSIQYVRNY